MSPTGELEDRNLPWKAMNLRQDQVVVVWNVAGGLWVVGSREAERLGVDLPCLPGALAHLLAWLLMCGFVHAVCTLREASRGQDRHGGRCGEAGVRSRPLHGHPPKQRACSSAGLCMP